MTNQPGNPDFERSVPTGAQHEGVTPPTPQELTRRQALEKKWNTKTRAPGALIALGGFIIILGTPFSWLRHSGSGASVNGLGTVSGGQPGNEGLEGGFGATQIILMFGAVIVVAGLIRAVGLLTRPMAILALVFAVFAFLSSYLFYNVNVSDSQYGEAGVGLWMAFVGSVIAIAVGIFGAIKR